MYDKSKISQGHGAAASGPEGEASRILFEVVRILPEGHAAAGVHIQAIDLHDAVMQARKLVGVGEVQIFLDGRRQCALHLRGRDDWWVEVDRKEASSDGA